MPGTVAILAGGGARRMGVDKALIEIGGVPVLARLVAAATAAGLRSVVVGRGPDERIDGVARWIPDDRPGEGPLAALATVLRAVGGEVILVACDMPLVDADALRWLAHATAPAQDDGSGAAAAHEGLVVRNEGVLEPLFARYAPGCLDTAERLLDGGRRSLGALIDAAPIAIVDAPEWLAPRLANMNTPDEARRLGAA